LVIVTELDDDDEEDELDDNGFTSSLGLALQGRIVTLASVVGQNRPPSLFSRWWDDGGGGVTEDFFTVFFTGDELELLLLFKVFLRSAMKDSLRRW
jgi:hypothetical protein